MVIRVRVRVNGESKREAGCGGGGAFLSCYLAPAIAGVAGRGGGVEEGGGIECVGEE